MPTRRYNPQGKTFNNYVQQLFDSLGTAGQPAVHTAADKEAAEVILIMLCILLSLTAAFHIYKCTSCSSAGSCRKCRPSAGWCWRQSR